MYFTRKFAAFLTICFSLFLINEASAQVAVAVFSSVKGTVTIVGSDGKTKTVTPDTQVKEGDVVKVGGNGSATILYFSGKEVSLAANENHSVRANQEQASDNILSNLWGSLTDLLSFGDKGTSQAGATRAWVGDEDRQITAVYPSETKIIEDAPIFKWKDHRKETAGKSYVVEIRSELTDFEYDIPVASGTEVEYPKLAPPLKEDEKYVWTVKDKEGVDVSPTVGFSRLNSGDKEYLEEDLVYILETCNSDNTNPQYYLLSAALYRDYGLMKQAENSIKALISLKPDMAQAYIMLATLYKETGRLDEAEAQEKVARDLTQAPSKSNDDDIKGKKTVHEKD